MAFALSSTTGSQNNGGGRVHQNMWMRTAVFLLLGLLAPAKRGGLNPRNFLDTLQDKEHFLSACMSVSWGLCLMPRISKTDPKSYFYQAGLAKRSYGLVTAVDASLRQGSG